MLTPRRLVPALLVLALAAASARAGDPPPAPPAPVRVLGHALSVRLLPDAHELIAEDRLTVEAGGAGGRLDLVLDAGLALRGPVQDAGGAPLASGRSGDRLTGIPVPPGRSEVVVRYGGVVFDAVQKAGGLTWVAGDGTRGLVSEKGVYLAGSSRWVPMPPEGGLARFDVRAWIPAPFLVVTQGTVPARSTVTSPGAPGAGAGPAPDALPPLHDGPSTTWNVLDAKAVLPTDSLSLVAGPYETQSRTVEGVTIATWFGKAQAADAPLWLDSMDEVVRRYARVLGPYPHPKFDIVENFFQTGYGMPGFTLLGDAVIQYVTQGAKRSGGRIPPGYLDHEYVHGWYGNGLFVDYARGNWCEALTTYCSNYLAKELESVGEARTHRRGVLEKWALRVKGAKDTPVRAFQEKTEDTDNDIGYGKGSLLFHLARRRMGDEAFWGTLRAFTQARVGTVVSWDDFLHAFDEASGLSVTAHVKPFLDRPGLPSVSVEVREPSHSLGHPLEVEARQAPAADGGPPFPLFLPLRVETRDGVEEFELDLSSGAQTLRLDLAAAPRTVAIDPDYHALRRIDERDLPPCLERTLLAGAGGAGVVVLTGGGEASLRPLAEQIAATKGLRVVGPEFDLATFSGPALLLGVAPKGAGPLSIGGSDYEDPAIAVLRSTAEKGRLRTVYTALSDAAAERAGRLPFYSWDPWVVFRQGRPIARDPRSQERPSTRLVLDDAPSPAAQRVRADVARLCAPDFDGRLPNTPGHAACATWLSGQLEGWAGVRALEIPWRQDALRRQSSRDLTVEVGGKAETWSQAFWPFSVGLGAGSTLTDSFAVVPWSDPSMKALAQDAAGRKVQVVFYALSPEAAAGLAPFLDGTDGLTPWSEAALAKPGRDGRPRARPPLAQWISAQRVRAWPDHDDREPLARTALPAAVAVSPERGQRLEALKKSGGKVSLSKAWDLGAGGASLYVGSEPWRLPSHAPRATPAPRPPAIVLSAHFDSFGKQGDALWVGADDNASGVACVLEILRRLPLERTGAELGVPPVRPQIVVLLPDGEEWGLRGSREAVARLTAEYDVRAVINLDSIGRAGSKPTHVLGLSKHPALARRVRNALETDGIVVGPDIDAYGYEEGSDHWPFHQAGIPAITLWASDYGVMNTADDTPEKVEPEGVARIAAALARLLREDLAGLAAAQDPPAER